jgi:hypothetical protein
MSPTSPAPQAAGHDRPALPAIRHPQRPHHGRDPRDGGATGATGSSSSACTAWARRCTRSCAAHHGTRCRIYAPGGARTATCWPISCGGFWKTARTRPSSTRSSTKTSRRPRWRADPFEPRRWGDRIRACRRRPDLFRRSGRTPRASTCMTGAGLRSTCGRARLRQRAGRRADDRSASRSEGDGGAGAQPRRPGDRSAP